MTGPRVTHTHTHTHTQGDHDRDDERSDERADSRDFLRQGGMISLNARGGRIRFEINLAAAREAGLTLSSHLLRLADAVLQ